MNRLRTACLLLPLLILAGPVEAAGEGGCAAFKWSLAREQDWFSAAPAASSVGSLPKPEGALALTLQPVGAVSFNPAPERKPAQGTFGAVVTVAAIERDGLYQVTLSDEAWIDVVQGGAAIKFDSFSGQKNCPGLRKSVRFNLKAGPATLQISGSKARQINVAIAPAS